MFKTDMLKIGITGASGVLGRHILDAFKKYEWFVFPGDITDRGSIKNWLYSTPKLDGIIHLAALVAVSRVDNDPSYAIEVNIEGLRNLIFALYDTGQIDKIWLFFASSAHVYKPSEFPISEESEVLPISFYGKTKLQAELLLQEFANSFKFDYCIGRIFSYTSPLQSKDFVIPSIYEKINNSQPYSCLTIRGGGNFRDFLTAHSIATIIVRLLDIKYNGIINIGSGSMLSIKDISEEIQRQVGRDDITLLFEAENPTKLIANISKLKSVSCHETIMLQDLVAYYINGMNKEKPKLVNGCAVAYSE